jgi:hemolysin III
MDSINLAFKPRFRGGIHGVSAVAAASLIVPMVFSVSGVKERLVMLLFSVSITLLLGVSALYHRIDWNIGTERWIRQLDHSLIFVAIAATNTPIAVFALSPWSGKFILFIVWGGSAVGIAIRFFFPDISSKAIAVPYILVGWSLVLVVADAWRNLGVWGSILIFVGGISYTLGAAVFAFQKPDPWPRTFGFHEVFHSLTFLGVSLHYCAIAFIVAPMAG